MCPTHEGHQLQVLEALLNNMQSQTAYQVLVNRQFTRQRDRPRDAKIDRVAGRCGRNRSPQAARAAVIEIRDRERRRHPRARAEQDETDEQQHALQCGEGEFQHNNDQASV